MPFQSANQQDVFLQLVITVTSRAAKFAAPVCVRCVPSLCLFVAVANNLQRSWRFDGEPPEAVLRDFGTIDWILGG